VRLTMFFTAEQADGKLVKQQSTTRERLYN